MTNREMKIVQHQTGGKTRSKQKRPPAIDFAGTIRFSTVKETNFQC